MVPGVPPVPVRVPAAVAGVPPVPARVPRVVVGVSAVAVAEAAAALLEVAPRQAARSASASVPGSVAAWA